MDQKNDAFSVRLLNLEALNMLFATLQGQFAANNILQQCSHPGFNAESFEVIREQIKIANTKLNDFFNGTNLLTDDPKQDEDGQELLESLDALKEIFVVTAGTIISIIRDEDWNEDPQKYQILTAYFAWRAYSRENYFKNFIKFYEKEVPEDLKTINAFRQKEKNAGLTIKLVSSFLATLKDPGADLKGFFAHLYFFAQTLPGYFYSQVHDINQIKSIGKKEFDFADADFNDEETIEWERFGFDAINAGYWRASGLSPENAAIWYNEGFFSAEDAGEWFFAGFDAAQAALWKSYNFTPILAVQWRNTGYDAEQCAILVSHSYHNPGALPNNPEAIQKIIDEGFKKD